MQARGSWPVLLVAACLLVLAPARAGATADFARETGQPCAYCHRGAGGPLTDEGEAFKAAGYRLPESEPGEETPAGDGSPVGEGGESAPARPLLHLPTWARTLLLWFHLVAMTAWLGAIIFVHVVQTPRVAGRGIPRGYFILAWPSIFLLGASGVLLTLGDVRALSDLLDSRWGVLLLTKVALYLLLLSVAVLVTTVIGPRLRRLAQAGSAHPLARHVTYAQEGRITVGYEGRIYDVTASRMWREGSHMGKHEAWQDLTAAMAAAPHGAELLKRYTVLEGGPAGTPPALRLFLVLAYGNLGLVLATLLVVAAWLAE